MIQIDGHSYEKIEYLIWKNYCRINYKEMNNKGTEVASDGYNQAQVTTF